MSAERFDELVRLRLLPQSPAGIPFEPFSVQTALDVMDANLIEASVFSAPFPARGSPEELDADARATNEAAAEIVRDHPSRFGFFAYLPIPHVDKALAETAYSLDTLHADGVLMMAHAGDTYLGDPHLDPVWEELDRRHAVVRTHPTERPHGPPASFVFPFFGFEVDFMLDTTRAALTMIKTGTLDRYPDVKVILAHGGGFLPYVGSRLVQGTYIGTGVGADPETVRRSLRSFYYDTAQWTSPYATPSLRHAADDHRILFGSDWNAVPSQAAAREIADQEVDPLVGSALAARIDRLNALELLPTLAARMRA